MFSVTSMLVNLVAATAILFGSISTVKMSQHDGWMSSILATLYGSYIVYIVYRLGMMFPGKTFIEYLPLIVGKIAGKILGAIYIVFFFYLTSSVLRIALALFYGTGAYKLTPPIVLALLLIIVSTYAVLSGFEVISRVMSIYFPVIAVFYILTICLAIPYMKLHALLPLGEAGFANVFKGSVVGFAYRGELFILAMILPYMKAPRDGLIAGNIASILLSFFLAGITITMVAVLGVETTIRSTYAIFFLGDFIPPIGIKIFLISLWIVAFWGKISILQFTICSGISQLLNLKSYNYVVLPVAALLVVLSFSFYRNVPDMLISIPATFPGVALFLEFLIPTLLLIIAWTKLKFSNNSESAPAANVNSQS